MKKYLLTLFVALFVTNTAFSQEINSASRPLKKHSIYVELGGNSLLYSINYDLLIPLSKGIKLSAGSGFSQVSTIKINDENYGPSFCVAPALNILFGRRAHHFETGISTFVPLHVGLLAIGARIGYRYQRPKGGFLFRFALTPQFVYAGMLPWVGVSLGFTF